MTRRDFDPATVAPDGRPPAKARLFDATVDGPYRGSINGETLSTQITVLTYGNDEPGPGRCCTSIPTTRCSLSRKAARASLWATRP
jgi:hypothetical protein